MTRTWHIPIDRDKLTRKQIAELFVLQDGRCPECGQKLQTKGHEPVEFIDEHLKPLSMGGGNELSNRGLVCKPCARVKTAEEATGRAKALRVRDKAVGAFKKASRPMPGSRASGWKKLMSGETVRREK